MIDTSSGFFLIFGWIADDCADLGPDVTLTGRDKPSRGMKYLLRHSRADVTAIFGNETYDFGYVLFGKTEMGTLVPDELSFTAAGARCKLRLSAERVSELRLLEELLAFLGGFAAHSGREAVLRQFLTEGARALIDEVSVRGQQRAAQVQQVERFGLGRKGPSFVTVVFGSFDAVMYQPLLFAKAGIKFGEWLYVCNSPELGDDLVRNAKTASTLFDLPIRVIVLTDNAGFGAANNLAMENTTSNEITLLNPDVHPLSMWSNRVNAALQPECFGDKLRGGLLFYDDQMLMHGGIYLEEDVFVARGRRAGTAPTCRLLRVEHYDKGVPFAEEEWTSPRDVPAVTGAVMAFRRDVFETMGGFSSDFIYGHYEDVDLCLRWSEKAGRVEVDPDLRLVHLEGLGSKTRLPRFHGAAIVNRHIFELRNRRYADARGLITEGGSR